MKQELSIPQGKTLYDYQTEGAKFLVSNGGHGFIADEMGLGKTIQAITAVNSCKFKKVLVVCPAVMRLTWEQEFKDWSVFKYKVQVLAKSKDVPDKDANIVICSYNYMTSKHAARNLRGFKYQCIVADEWHSCKSWKSQRTKSMVRQWVPRAEKFIALTGTPITRCVTDLHSQLSPFANVGKFAEFARMFAYEKFNGFGIEYSGLRNKEKLWKLCKPFMKRRLKKKVLTQLPAKIMKNVPVEIPRRLAEESLDYVDAAIAQITGEKYEGYNDLAEHIATIKKSLGAAKIKPTVEYTLELFEQGVKQVVVFAYHTKVIDAIAELLRAKGKTVETITGSTPAQRRQEHVKNFQAGQIEVLVVNMIAGGVGITLTAAHHAIMAELDWTPSNLQQAMDRLHRISQENVVEVHFLLGKDSLDQQIIGILKEKIKVAKGALGDDEA